MEFRTDSNVESSIYMIVRWKKKIKYKEKGGRKKKRKGKREGNKEVRS